MKSKSTKPVKPEIEFRTYMRVDKTCYAEGDIVTIKYSKGDDILTATGRIAFIGPYGGLGGPYIRLDCSSEWHAESVIIESNDILDCKDYFEEAVSYCINDVAATKDVLDACK